MLDAARVDLEHDQTGPLSRLDDGSVYKVV